MRLLVIPPESGESLSDAPRAQHAPVAKTSAEELLRMARSGDSRMGAALFDRFEQTVNRIVWRLLGADEAHDDMVHEVFIALFDGLHSVRDPAAMDGWVAIVTVNKVRNELRRRRVRQWWQRDVPEVFEFAESPAPTYEARELLTRTYEALARLPANERIAFILRFIDQQPLAAVAAACGCSLATIKRRLCSAQARFRRLAERDPVLAERLLDREES